MAELVSLATSAASGRTRPVTISQKAETRLSIYGRMSQRGGPDATRAKSQPGKDDAEGGGKDHHHADARDGISGVIVAAPAEFLTERKDHIERDGKRNPHSAPRFCIFRNIGIAYKPGRYHVL
jgi:hypothetical protein